MRKSIAFNTGLFIGLFIILINGNSSSCQESDFSNAGAVIESDSIQISLTGNKTDFIPFIFKRYLRVHINSEEGKNAFSRFELPENFDPSLIIHAPAQRNTGKPLTNVDIRKFRVKITRPDGTIFSPEITPEIEMFRGVDYAEDKFGEYQKYIYAIEDISPGDILEIEYQYMVLYSENMFSLMTLRIFFHDRFPILEKYFSFTRPKDLDAEVNAYFCQYAEHNEGNTISNTLSFKDLDACINESGIWPYLSLPHIILSIRPDEMVYTIPYTFQESYIPFYVFGASQREQRHLTIVRAMAFGTNTSQYNQIRRFIEKHTANVANDTTGYSQLYAIHNYIADNFEFDEDLDYFNRLDIRNDLMGDYITAGVIRDRCRYDTYVALISGLGLNYFTAYLADKRSGIISPEYFEPTISNDNLFAVLLKNDNIQFLYPKKERFGYYLNELPFYFEDVTVRLVYLDDFRDYKKAIEAVFRSIKTPASNSQDNVRTQSANVYVNLEDLTTSFNANILLSGQFSTLGRGAYLYDSRDNTVNPIYYMKLWEAISPGASPEIFEVESISQDFPFKATFKAEFMAQNCVSMNTDTIILDLTGWFNHVVDQDLDSGRRCLDYYPDFMFTDTYNFKVEFDKNVKVVSSLPDTEIKNDYGQFIVKGIQMLDGSIVFSSRFTVNSQVIPASDISYVEEIQNAIESLNSMKVIVVEAD